MFGTQLPIVFFACVNSYQRNRRRFRYLVEERKHLAGLLGSTPERQYYAPVQKGNLPHEQFMEMLRRREYSERVVILHFTGHADGDDLRIESDNFETALKLSALSDMVASLRNLQAVFLSGCATPGIIETLLRRDIPAVIVTQTQERDPRAQEIAESFYYYLGQGCTVMEAVDYTTVRFQDFRNIEIKYEIETDEWIWEAKEGTEPLPWGLYYLTENADRINQRIHRRRSLPVEGGENESQSFRKRWPRWLRYSAAALLLALTAVGLTFLIGRPPDMAYLLAF